MKANEMGKYSPVAIAPKYMETFRCIGSECEETCCSGGWRIDIDKHTYKKYRTIAIRELADKLKAVVVKNEHSQTPHDYAQIKLDENGACSLLNEKNLCEIHARLGADHLSMVCQTYPKQFIQKESELRLYATLSCPEAARKALLNPAAMDMISMTLPFPNNGAVPPVRRIRGKKDEPFLLFEFSSYILETASHIIRLPEHRSWEAMIIISLMVRKMGRYLSGQDCADPRQAIVDTMMNFIDPGYLKEAKELIHGIAIERSHQIKLLMGVFRIYFSKFANRSSFRQTISDVADGLRLHENDLKGSEFRYNEAEEKWFTPFDNGHPYLLKNYLLNDMGKNCFPLGRNDGLEKEFLKFALRFSLIRMALIGISGLRKEAFGEADYVRVVYTFSRNMEHNSAFMEELMDLLEANGMSNVAAAALLMR